MIVVIDRVETTLNDVSLDFSGFQIDGEAAHMAVLREAKLKNADVLIATTHGDNVNLTVAQAAKRRFHVRHVPARVFAPKREEVYAQWGIETICPTSVAADLFPRAVANSGKGQNGAAS